MRTYTAHLRRDRVPVLVREAWSWGAFLFGPLWLLANRAWIAAVLHACIAAVVGLAPLPFRAAALLALGTLAGLFGHDLVRWSLGRRGYMLAHVVAARDDDAALVRLLTAQPDLLDQMP